MVTFNVNNRTHSVNVSDPDMPLLYLLRNQIGLNAPRFGCGLGQCGACTVLVDGRATRSCSFPVSAVGTSKVTTLEGLGLPGRPHPLQAAFIAEGAAQCGYCANGMILQAADLLAEKPRPTEEDIREALADNLCRCGTHLRIVKAVQRAAATMAETGRK